MKRIVTGTLFLKQPQFWLISIFSGLYSIYLSLVWRVENPSQLGMSVLFGLVALVFLQEKQQQRKFLSSFGASFVGAGLILGVLWFSVLQFQPALLRLMPFSSALGVVLLVSGFTGITQYRRELTIFFFLGVPSVIASFLFDLSPLTAVFSRLILYYTGFAVSGEGVLVMLPTGSIEVSSNCSGIDQINYLLGLSVLCLMMFPIRGWQYRILVPLMGIMLGFVTNVIRISILTVLIASNRNFFNHLHTGEGSYLFAIVGVLLLGGFYFLLHHGQDSTPSSTPH